MRWRRGLAGLALAGLLWRAGTEAAWGQLRAKPKAYEGVDGQGGVTTLPAALRTMSEQADVVFVGTVERVQRVSGTPGTLAASAGVVEIVFRVEGAVRGVSGSEYTLREWGGLWPAGERRYEVGDRRLMLLHRPGATGLSSPVAGMEGAIPVRGVAARVGAGSEQGVTTQPVADLRWIAAKLQRPLPFAMAGSATAAPGKAPLGGRIDESGPGGDAMGTARISSAVRVEGEPSAKTMAAAGAGGAEPMEDGGKAETGKPVLVHGVVSREGAAVTALSTDPDAGPTMPVAELLQVFRTWSPPKGEQ